jgi:flagellin-like hook-associated protein FlgL
MLNSEFSSLRDDIDRVAAATTFDGVSLLSGDGASPGSPNVIDFGSSDTAGESVTVSINAADSTSLSPDLATVDLASQAGGERGRYRGYCGASPCRRHPSGCPLRAGATELGRSGGGGD